MIEHTEQTAPERIDNRFTVVRTLGSGANGKVVLVQDAQLDESLLALKLLHPHVTFKSNSYARFRTETRVTMQLAHPNILPAYGMGKTAAGITYLKLAYNDGPTLEHLIEQHPHGCRLDQALFIIGEMAKGMEYAHRKGIIHRDLKPANVLLSATGAVRISDFGLAQIIRSEAALTGRGDIVGTPQYIAPEVMRGELADSRADIYAFGVITFELLTGSAPYSANSFWELADLVLHSEVPDPRNCRPEIPDDLAAILMRCLAKDRSQRYPSFTELLHALSVTQNEAEGHGVSSRQIENQPDAVGLESQDFQGFFGRWLQQNFHGSLTVAIWTSIAVLLPLLPPLLNTDAREKYTTLAVTIEKLVGTELLWLRALFNVPLGLHWPECVSDRLGEHSMLAVSFVKAGYPPDTYDPVSKLYPIQGAVVRNDIELVQRLLNAGASVNIRADHGATPALMAANWGDLKLMQVLLEANADPNLQNNSGLSPLLIAAERGRVDVIRLLLSHAANPNLQDREGNAPLHKAIYSLNPEAVKVLVENGADPHLQNSRGQTPLQLAANISGEQLRVELEAALGLRRE